MIGENKLKIGQDPWIGYSGNYKLLYIILKTLHIKGIAKLANASWYGIGKLDSKLENNKGIVTLEWTRS